MIKNLIIDLIAIIVIIDINFNNYFSIINIIKFKSNFKEIIINYLFIKMNVFNFNKNNHYSRYAIDFKIMMIMDFTLNINYLKNFKQKNFIDYYLGYITYIKNLFYY